MQMRITTGGVLKGYKSNLMKSFIASNNARIKVLTGRNFNSYAENPAAATQAFQLRYSFWRTDSQLTASQHVINQYEGAFKALDQVAEKVKNSTENSSNAAILRGLNDPTGEGREALGTELQQLAESIVQSMNTKYGDDFIFAGADGLNVPFSWAEDGKTLLYRGIPVDTKVPDEEYYKKEGVDVEYYTYEIKKENGATDSFIATTKQPTAPLPGADPDGNIKFTITDINGDSHEVTLKKPQTDEQGNVIENTEGTNKLTYNRITVHLNADGTFGDAKRVEQAVEYKGPEAIEDPASPTTPIIPGWVNEENGNWADVTVEDDTMQKVLTKVLDDSAFTIQPEKEAGAKELAVTYLKNLHVNSNLKLDEPLNLKEINKAKEDLAKLDYLKDEPMYVDLGLGFQEDENGNLIGASAFNASLPGLVYIGYGVDEDGDPKNLASLSRKLGELLSSCKDGTWPDKKTQDDANRLQLKLKAACDKFTNEYTQLTTRADFLKQNHTQLTDNADTINEQIDTIENMDLADAITSFSWAMYSYNAALKVGNSILSQSLMDYMN